MVKFVCYKNRIEKRLSCEFLKNCVCLSKNLILSFVFFFGSNSNDIFKNRLLYFWIKFREKALQGIGIEKKMNKYKCLKIMLFLKKKLIHLNFGIPNF